MKKYFTYLLKKNLLPLACLTLFCIILYVIPIAVDDYSWWNAGNRIYIELYHGNISVALAILSVFIPIAMFSYKMDKRSVDMHYSLPVNKTKILASHFLVGLILMYSAYTVAYVWGFATVAMKVQRIHLIYYLYLYLASLVPAFVTYSVTAFIYTRANTVVDGVISVAGALCLMAMAVSTVNEMFYQFNWYPYRTDGSWFFSFTPLARATTVFGDAVKDGYIDRWNFTPESYYYESSVCLLVGGILWTLLGIGAAAGLILTEKHSKAERCGQISESLFCYKVQLPAYTAMLISTAIPAIGEITIICAIVFAVFVLSIVYKRTIKIGWRFAIVLFACVVLGILLATIPATIYDAMYPPIIE